MDQSSDADIEAERLAIENESLPGLFTRLGDGVREVARAEIDCFRAKALRRLVEARGAIVFAAAALLLAIGALITALIGILFIVAFYVGIAWATLIVVVVTLIVAAVLGHLALARFQRALDPEKGVS